MEMTTRTKKLLAVCAVALLAALAAWVRLGPLPAGFLDRNNFVSTRVLDRRGEVLYETLSPAGTRSDWLEPKDLPQPLVNATIAAEDHRFFSHLGVDPVAIGRAAWRDAPHTCRGN